MIPGKRITPLAIAVMGALSNLPASADTFNNASGDLIDYQYTAALLAIGTGEGNSGKVVISANGDVTADALQVGISSATGVLDIINGARLTVQGTSNLGGLLQYTNRERINSGGASTMNVSGSGSQFDTSQLIIGANGGTGTLNIKDGGKVNVSGAIILAEYDYLFYQPTNARGTLVVDGAGSELNVTGSIVVGQANGSGQPHMSPDGYGALHISNGAKVHIDQGLQVGEWSGDGSGVISSEYNVVTVSDEGSVLSAAKGISVGSNSDIFASILSEQPESYIFVTNGATLSAPALHITYGGLVIGGTPGTFWGWDITRAGNINVDDIYFYKKNADVPWNDASLNIRHNEDDYQLKSNLHGEGNIQSQTGTTTFSGDNTAFIGNLYISDGSAINVTEQKNLGNAWIRLYSGWYATDDGGRLNINASQDWEWVNQLSGTWEDDDGNLMGGTVAVNTNGHRFSFTSGDITGDFSGTLALGNTQFSLDGVNTAALSQMLLRAGDQSVITLGEGQQTIDRFAFDGGTVIFGDVAPGKTVADNSLHTTARLDLSGTGQVQVNLTDVTNNTPTVSPDTPLLAQDDGNALIQLASSDDKVIGSGGNLTLTDSSGNAISSAVVSDIVQNGVVAARGTYDYRLTSGTDGDGLYINYGLKGIALLTAGSEALVLDAAGGSGNAADLSAQVTGSGSLAVTGQPGEVVSLSNSANDYTGITDIRSGTLAMFNSRVLGNTAQLKVAGEAGFNMNGHAQTVGSLSAAAGSVVDLNGGELTLAQGGSAAGTLAGDGHLVVAGGTLAVSGANTQFSARTTVAEGAAAELDHTQGLGNGDIHLAGTLTLGGAEGILANNISQKGQLALTGSQVTLAGDNAGFAGHFNVDAGSSLTAGSADQLGQAAIHNDGTLTLNSAGDWTVSNVIQGAGNLVKTGAGSATLTADSAGLTGDTDIQQGNLTLGSVQAPVTLASRSVTVGESGQLSGFGSVQGDIENRGTLLVGGDKPSTTPALFSVGGSVQNSGRMSLSGGTQSVGNQLIIEGDYTGNGGSLHLNTALGDDSSATDRLIVKGNTSGTTSVSVTNAGGSGAQTLNGIEIITIEGRSDGEFTQNGRIVAGAYDYTLVRGQATHAGNWYLTSDITGGGSVEQPDDNSKPDTGSKPGKESAIRPEAGSYAESLAAANTMFLSRRYDRQGQTLYINPVTGEQEDTSLWLRNVGSHSRSHSGNGQLKTTGNRYVVQMGGSLASGSYTGHDRWNIGAMAGYGHQNSTTRSMVNANNTKGNVSGYSVGVYGTWNADEASGYGPYVDGWLQYSWFNNTVKGNDIGSESWDSSGFTASLEAGYMWSLGRFTGSRGSQMEWLIQPQAQVVWMGVKADDHREANGTAVKGKGDGNIQTRLGFRTLLRGHHAADEGKSRQFQPYTELNWIHNTRAFGTQLNGVTVNRQGTRNVAELKLGVEGQINRKLSVWANIGEQIGDKGYNETTGMLGVKYNF